MGENKPNLRNGSFLKIRKLVIENCIFDNSSFIGPWIVHNVPQESFFQSDGLHIDHADFRSELFRQTLHENYHPMDRPFCCLGLPLAYCACWSIYLIINEELVEPLPRNTTFNCTNWLSQSQLFPCCLHHASKSLGHYFDFQIFQQWRNY